MQQGLRPFVVVAANNQLEATGEWCENAAQELKLTLGQGSGDETYGFRREGEPPGEPLGSRLSRSFALPKWIIVDRVRHGESR